MRGPALALTFVSVLSLGISASAAGVPGTAETEIHRADRIAEGIGSSAVLGSSSCCPSGAFVAGELVVGFEPDTTAARVEEIATEVGAAVTRLIVDLPGWGPVYLLCVPPGEELALILALQAFPEVRYAEPDYIVCAPELPLCECCPSAGLTCPSLPPCLPDEEPSDADGDRLGDVCDPCTDTDTDGFGDPGFPASSCPPDNCPDAFNPDHADSDGDGLGDRCDACPTFPDPTNTCDAVGDADGDGKADNEDECTVLTAGQAAGRSRLSVHRLNQAPADHRRRLKWKGEFLPAGGVASRVAPDETGVHLRIADVGSALVDVDIPPGQVGSVPGGGCDSRDGWTRREGTAGPTFIYRNHSGFLDGACSIPAGGIDRIRIRDRRSIPGVGAVRFHIVGKHGDYDPQLPVTDLEAALALARRPSEGVASPEATVGDCADSRWVDPPQAGPMSCRERSRSGRHRALVCKAP
jgi:hypothetical protein